MNASLEVAYVTGTVAIAGSLNSGSKLGVGPGGSVEIGGNLSAPLGAGSILGHLHIMQDLGSGGTIAAKFIWSTGNITIDGDAVGSIQVAPFFIDGSISVGGTLSGDIHVATNLNGEIAIGGHVNGDVDIDGNVPSTGSIDVAAYLRGGRILVDGLLDAPITIGQGTGVLSQINLFGGVGPSGQVVINEDGGNYNADGDIWVGSTITLPPLPPIDFDGCIQVNDNGATPPGFGNLNGDMTVVGCHDFGDTVPVCVEGMTHGRITLIQTLCTNQATRDSSCPACA